MLKNEVRSNLLGIMGLALLGIGGLPAHADLETEYSDSSAVKDEFNRLSAKNHQALFELFLKNSNLLNERPQAPAGNKVQQIHLRLVKSDAVSVRRMRLKIDDVYAIDSPIPQSPNPNIKWYSFIIPAQGIGQKIITVELEGDIQKAPSPLHFQSEALRVENSYNVFFEEQTSGIQLLAVLQDSKQVAQPVLVLSRVSPHAP